MGAGLVLWRRNKFWRGFAMQALSWGAIDALIALGGQFAARRRQAALREPDSPEVQTRETENLRRLLWINAGLDVLYVSSGLLWALTRGQRDALQRGNGWGVVVQGLFLMVFDTVHARRLRS